MTITLYQQITEVHNELAMRQDVYPRRVAAGKMRQGEADYRMERMRAVLATLQLIQRHEAAVREAIKAEKAKEATCRAE